MGKGRGRRRRQANYLASHGHDQALPPPPKVAEASSVPSKLRRIMNFMKSSSPSEPQSNPQYTVRSANVKNGNKGQNKVEKEASESRKGESPSLRDICLQAQNDETHDQSSNGLSNESSKKKQKKRKRGEDLQELMDRFKIAPVRKGLSERKKKFLQDKKKKNKRSVHFHTNEPNASIHQQEKIRFGDIVDAPPKISTLPKKAIDISAERLRQQAVEAYRQKKNWVSRPGSHQPPGLVNMATV